MKQCLNRACIKFDDEEESKCKRSNYPEECHLSDILIENQAPSSGPFSDGLSAKLIEIDSLIRCIHLDMGGNDKYHISPRHNDQIGKLIKECLYIAEGN